MSEENTRATFAEIDALAFGDQVSPADVIERAKHPSSALHDRFDWHVSESERLDEAARLIKLTGLRCITFCR